MFVHCCPRGDMRIRQGYVLRVGCAVECGRNLFVKIPHHHVFE